MKALIPTENIQEMIYLIRGYKVMLDRDLAQLYKVTTFNLNKAVKRNKERFPEDFMFQLTKEEWKNLIFQNGRSSLGSQVGISRWGGRRHAPYVFTEQGVAMLSSVLRSRRAVQVNIAIMRTFIQLREMISANKELSKRLAALDRRVTGHGEDIQQIYQIILELTSVKRIGFKAKKK